MDRRGDMLLCNEQQEQQGTSSIPTRQDVGSLHQPEFQLLQLSKINYYCTQAEKGLSTVEPIYTLRMKDTT